MLILDTHVLLWFLEGSDRLGDEARHRIAAASSVVYSAITAWEMGMLIRKDQLTLGMAPDALLHLAGRQAGIRELPVSSAIALEAGLLPSPLHGDPGDRIIVATARALDCPLVTADRAILAYAAAGHVKAVDARA